MRVYRFDFHQQDAIKRSQYKGGKDALDLKNLRRNSVSGRIIRQGTKGQNIDPEPRNRPDRFAESMLILRLLRLVF